MKAISVNNKFSEQFIPIELNNIIINELISAYNTLIDKTGKGKEFTGWIDTPKSILDSSLLYEVNEHIGSLKNKIDSVVVIGIGGSYLGAKAIIDALNYQHISNGIKIHYAGNDLNGINLSNLLNNLEREDYAVVVISKSGTTIEPAIAFRIIKEHIEKKYGTSEAANRIIAITDKEKGKLRETANQNNYKTFVIPDDVGGRFSVLTPVGLVPLAFAGIDINELVRGANDMAEICTKENDISKNPALQYAMTRYSLHALGFDVEILVNYLNQLNSLCEWWKQLFGESEGKDGKGLFPASTSFTTDLHSLGQFIQDGSKILFETILHIENIDKDVIIPKIENDFDGLNYLAGKSLHQINKIAEEATTQAHVDGGVPNITINIPQLNEYYLGQLIYMFEFACGIGGYMLDVNPFDQPGVEAYKKNMFKLLQY
ncbi:glucose-6-phosphate isomerase [Bacteroidales bacterium OttesenSCG-928-K03]|nr:glucose-6-phosphate isomerase [Odoribacter sp. OttesenSCG-928-L07]MDL2239735.1 glucose-6-phosphate isomerase [Bacteroidales bacterium OttesenSCG-928-L14]MDL2242449.1 glucose-6-phosphate isomerase [Bacteroidales bacterium OttesenSCG-928-K03]